MKYMLLIFLASSCATNDSTGLPVFDKKRDCSVEALEYFSSNPNEESAKKSKKVRSMMFTLVKPIKNCYEAELEKGEELAYNMCVVIGYDKKGKQDFLQYSINKKEVSGSLGKCLNKLKTRELFKSAGLKGFKVLQSYQLYPKH